MAEILYQKKTEIWRKCISAFVAFTFSLSLVSGANAQYITNLPKPGEMVLLSPAFEPAVLKAMTIHPENPLQFDFIVDRGQDKLSGDALKDETQKLLKYFLAAMTIPDDESWVNLSPYEGDRIVPDMLGSTDMGKAMLEQDYLLKQLSASLTNPQEEIGKKFWDTVYKKAFEKFGTTTIPINTFNKVWIIPDKAVILEDKGYAYIGETHLKVMLDEDYTSIKENLKNKKFGTDQISKDQVEELSSVSSEVVREIIIPELEKEINQGKNFAQVRQIYNSVILATWYKQTLKDSLLGKIYVDKNKIKGVDIAEKDIKQKVYEQYLAAFRKGVYNLIKEDYDLASKETLPRKYFSGGFDWKATSSAIQRLPVRGSSFNFELTPIARAIREGMGDGLYAKTAVILTEERERATVAGLVAERAKQARDGSSSSAVGQPAKKYTLAEIKNNVMPIVFLKFQDPLVRKVLGRLIRDIVQQATDESVRELYVNQNDYVADQRSTEEFIDWILNDVGKKIDTKRLNGEINPQKAEWVTWDNYHKGTIPAGKEKEQVKITFFATSGNPIQLAHIGQMLNDIANNGTDFALIVLQGTDTRKPDLSPMEVRVNILEQSVLKSLAPFIQLSQINEDGLGIDGEENVLRIARMNPGVNLQINYLFGLDHFLRTTWMRKGLAALPEIVFQKDEIRAAMRISDKFLKPGTTVTDEDVINKITETLVRLAADDKAEEIFKNRTSLFNALVTAGVSREAGTIFRTNYDVILGGINVQNLLAKLKGQKSAVDLEGMLARENIYTVAQRTAIAAAISSLTPDAFVSLKEFEAALVKTNLRPDLIESITQKKVLENFFNAVPILDTIARFENAKANMVTIKGENAPFQYPATLNIKLVALDRAGETNRKDVAGIALGAFEVIGTTPGFGDAAATGIREKGRFLWATQGVLFALAEKTVENGGPIIPSLTLVKAQPYLNRIKRRNYGDELIERISRNEKSFKVSNEVANTIALQLTRDDVIGVFETVGLQPSLENTDIWELPAPASSTIEGVNVLHVEDQTTLQIITEAALKQEKVADIQAEISGEDVLKRNLSNFGLILMDNGLAGKMTGLEAAEVILNRPDFSGKIIFVSGDFDDINSAASLALKKLMETYPNRVLGNVGKLIGPEKAVELNKLYSDAISSSPAIYIAYGQSRAVSLPGADTVSKPGQFGINVLGREYEVQFDQVEGSFLNITIKALEGYDENGEPLYSEENVLTFLSQQDGPFNFDTNQSQPYKDLFEVWIFGGQVVLKPKVEGGLTVVSSLESANASLAAASSGVASSTLITKAKVGPNGTTEFSLNDNDLRGNNNVVIAIAGVTYRVNFSYFSSGIPSETNVKLVSVQIEDGVRKALLTQNQKESGLFRSTLFGDEAVNVENAFRLNIDNVRRVMTVTISGNSATVSVASASTIGMPAQDSDGTVGGIDFDPSLLNLQIKRNGKGVPLPLPQQNLENINIDGLYPVIINIQPATIQNFPFLSSAEQKEKVPELSMR